MTYRKLLSGFLGLAFLCSCASLRTSGPNAQASSSEEEGEEIPVGEDGAPEEDVAAENVDATPEDLGDPTQGTARTMNEIQADRDAQNTFPLVQNEFVDQWIRYFTETKNGRKTFEKWLSRLHRYGDLIYKTMKEDGLPTDLMYLAMIESGFSPKATSPVGAAGVWQFMPQTGKNYGMTINHWYDERRDIVAATHASARYLKELHQIFGSWYLAAASYNAGEGRTLRVVREHRSRNFWELARGKKNFRAETRNYVPKIIAAALISKNPEKYGFTDVQFEEPLKWEVFDVPAGVDLRSIGEIVKADGETMQLLNPELRRGITPPDVESYKVRIPVGTSALLAAQKDELKSRKHGFFVTHKLARGETLSHVSRRYGVDIRTIMDLNNISNAKRLRSGQVLQIPVDYRGGRSKKTGSSSWQPSASRTIASVSSKGATYKVKRGDNLTEIARRFDVSVAELRSANRLKGSTLAAGRTLKIPGASAAAPQKKRASYKLYRVRRGDTLTGISRKHGVSVSELKQANDMERGRELQAGDRLRIPQL
jgi:membrane-bound lytic murein transglycosylase D